MKGAFQRELARYYAMSKDFVGPEQADDLFYIHESLMENDRAYGYMYAAGSAAAESGLMALNSDNSSRHHRLAAARIAWQKAQDAFIYKHMHDGWNEARLMCIPDRVQVQVMFLDIYHEMVEGYVEEATLGKLHASLVRFSSLNKELHDYSETTGDWATTLARRGLGYEIGTLMTVTRLGCPSLFTIPATARADHGGNASNTTHDVRLIQQSHGKVKWCVPIEVKPTESQIDQYDSAYVRGRVELLLPSSLNPLELSDFMQAELGGNITKNQLEELDNITSRVLQLAKDYRAREEYSQQFAIGA